MFTCVGVVRDAIDCCDHEHSTREEAQKCLVAFLNEMRKLGKQSNRQVVEAESLDAVYDEADELKLY